MEQIKKIQTISLEEIEISKEIISIITPAYANKYRIIPIEKKDNILILAADDRTVFNLADEIRFIVDMDIQIRIAGKDDIKKALSKYYHIESDEVDQYIEKIDKELVIDTKKESKINAEELASELPIIKLVDLILTGAVSGAVSDIHLEPYEDGLKVRYRIDGVLYDMKMLPKKLSLPVISRIKVMSSLDISETRIPQDGRIDFNVNVNDMLVDLRVSTLPTIFGESIVMRVLDKSNISLSLNEIGLKPKDEKKIKEIMKYPNGIVLTTGPTGSGKTTTLYSMIKEINTIDIKTITTEDPVEYDIDGIIQVAANPKIGLDFVKCLRHILRQDPDIIMVGEIRDSETAKMAIQSSLTGHLVLSTLHTNDAPGSITRLIDMGVEPFLITSTVNAIIAQRLVRTLCKKCKVKKQPSEKILKQAGLMEIDIINKEIYIAEGCSICNNTGYKGRVGIFEILILNDEIRNLIIKGASTADIRSCAKKSGMSLLREDGVKKVFQGITSLEEILKET